MLFEERVILVTGARRGIGAAIAKMFTEHEKTVVIGTATDESGVKDINMYLADTKGTGMKLDVTSKQSVDLFFKKVYEEFGKIDILINNAGIIRDKILLRMKDDEWQSVIDVNLTSVYRMSKIAIRSMIKKRYGRIINIGSVVGFVGNIGQVNYAAAKSGLIGLTRSLALELASRGVTVNLITPGFINTDMVKKLTEKQSKAILSKIPMNCFGDPKDIANAVMFFASDNARYITGQTLHINGGMYMA